MGVNINLDAMFEFRDRNMRRDARVRRTFLNDSVNALVDRSLP